MPSVIYLEFKKSFLYEGALLYEKMISLAPYDAINTPDVLQRYLAFRVIVNAMAFEELIDNRQHAMFRKIRDVLLAHKQEPQFFEGYRAAEEIRNISIKPLLDFMATSISHGSMSRGMPELEDPITQSSFRTLVKNILRNYQESEYSTA